MTDEELMAEWLTLTGHRVFEGHETEADVASAWRIELSSIKGCVIAALRWHGDYEGGGFVLLNRGGKLFEVSGSHCSCYGLEDQWSEEETSIAALKKRTWDKYGAEVGAAMKRLFELFENMGTHQ